MTIVLLAVVSALTVCPVDTRSATVGQRSAVSGPTKAPDCRPVQHDNLWQRLNLEGTDYDTGTRFAAMPVEGRRRKRSVMDIDSIEEEVVGPKRSKLNLMKLETEGQKEEEEEERRRRKKKKGVHLVQQQTRLKRRTKKHKPNPKKVAVNEPWQCRMESKWKKMDDGVFPPYVLTGRCKQTKCMMELYECTPRKYVIKVLKKVDAACFPVPAIALNSTYEEAWTFVDYKVTVGCDCVKRSAGRYFVTPSQS